MTSAAGRSQRCMWHVLLSLLLVLSCAAAAPPIIAIPNAVRATIAAASTTTPHGPPVADTSPSIDAPSATRNPASTPVVSIPAATAAADSSNAADTNARGSDALQPPAATASVPAATRPTAPMPYDVREPTLSVPADAATATPDASAQLSTFAPLSTTMDESLVVVPGGGGSTPTVLPVAATMAVLPSTAMTVLPTTAPTDAPTVPLSLIPTPVSVALGVDDATTSNPTLSPPSTPSAASSSVEPTHAPALSVSTTLFPVATPVLDATAGAAALIESTLALPTAVPSINSLTMPVPSELGTSAPAPSAVDATARDSTPRPVEPSAPPAATNSPDMTEAPASLLPSVPEPVVVGATLALAPTLTETPSPTSLQDALVSPLPVPSRNVPTESNLLPVPQPTLLPLADSLVALAATTTPSPVSSAPESESASPAAPSNSPSLETTPPSTESLAVLAVPTLLPVVDALVTSVAPVLDAAVLPTATAAVTLAPESLTLAPAVATLLVDSTAAPTTDVATSMPIATPAAPVAVVELSLPLTSVIAYTTLPPVTLPPVALDVVPTLLDSLPAAVVGPPAPAVSAVVAPVASTVSRGVAGGPVTAALPTHDLGVDASVVGSTATRDNQELPTDGPSEHEESPAPPGIPASVLPTALVPTLVVDRVSALAPQLAVIDVTLPPVAAAVDVALSVPPHAPATTYNPASSAIELAVPTLAVVVPLDGVGLSLNVAGVATTTSTTAASEAATDAPSSVVSLPTLPTVPFGVSDNLPDVSVTAATTSTDAPGLTVALPTLPVANNVDVAVNLPGVSVTAGTTTTTNEPGLAVSVPSLPAVRLDDTGVSANLPSVSVTAEALPTIPVVHYNDIDVSANLPGVSTNVPVVSVTAGTTTNAPAVAVSVPTLPIVPTHNVVVSANVPGASVTVGATPTNAPGVVVSLPTLPVVPPNNVPGVSVNVPGVSVTTGTTTTTAPSGAVVPGVTTVVRAQPPVASNTGVSVTSAPRQPDHSVAPAAAATGISQPPAQPQVAPQDARPSSSDVAHAVVATDRQASAAPGAPGAPAAPKLAAETTKTSVSSAPATTKTPVSTASTASPASLVVVDSLVFDANSKAPTLLTTDKQLRLSDTTSSLEPVKALDLTLVPWSPTDEPKKYIRGQTTIQNVKLELADNSGLPGGGAANKDLPLVIGGKRRGRPGDTAVSARSAQVYESLRYSASLAAALSLALLVGFHFASLDPRLTWRNARWSPNTWECVLYVTYVQHATTSLSALTLLKTPYFLWEFTDTFSWTNLLFQPLGSSESSDTTTRRLRTIVLDGLVGYSDRIGHDETRIMSQCVYAFALLTLALGSAIGAVTLIGKLTQRTDALPLGRNQITANASVVLRLRGLGVLLWYFALFPLSLTASFEISMEVQANLIVLWPMALSVAMLLGVCSLGLAAAARVVLPRTERELRRFHTKAVWGALYADSTHAARMFFMLGASIQIVSGVAIGVFGSSSTLLVLLVAVQLLYVFTAYTLAPFAHSTVRIATYSVSALKLLNFGLAYSFLQSSELSTTARERIANVYLGVNAAVLFAWFLRHLVLFCACVAAYSAREQGPRTPLSSVGTSGTGGAGSVAVNGSDDDPASRKIAAASARTTTTTTHHSYMPSLSPAPSTTSAPTPMAPTDWHACQWHRIA